MLPGKKYAPEDIIRLVRRRLWWLLVPFAVVSAATAVGARMLPDVYRSDALILVVPQRVPDAYVTSTVSTRIEDRLQASTQKILSRAQLEELIQEFDLYPDLRQTRYLDEIIPTMRGQHIQVVPVRGDAFRVSFTGGDPRTAQAVTARLASLFIDWSETERQQKAQGTSEFFEAMLEDARSRLVQQEQALAQYRQRHSGELPEQQQSNMQALNGVQLQIRTTLDSIQRDMERRSFLERQLGDLEAQAPATTDFPVQPTGSASGNNAPMTAAAALADARAARAALLARGLRPDHPDIKIVERRIEDLRAKVEAEALAAPLSTSGLNTLAPAEAARLKRIGDIQTELEQLRLQIEGKQEEETRLRDMVDEYQRRIDAAPIRGTELIELTRDYDTLRGNYNGLLRKKEDSRIAESLEERQVGENFKMLDQASLPQTPISPNRRLITLAGMGAGLGLGLVLVALFEYSDNSFQLDGEVTRITGLPVLAVVPLMLSSADRKRAFRWRWLTHIGLGGTVVGCLAVLGLTFIP